MLPPCIVTLTDPVAAPLALDTKLSWLEPTDKAALTLPYRSPAVICTLMLAVPPCAVRQPTDVSDCHAVPSQPVQTPAIDVKLDTPMLAP
jgi:hypothetical protein